MNSVYSIKELSVYNEKPKAGLWSQNKLHFVLIVFTALLY